MCGYEINISRAAVAYRTLLQLSSSRENTDGIGDGAHKESARDHANRLYVIDGVVPPGLSNLLCLQCDEPQSRHRRPQGGGDDMLPFELHEVRTCDLKLPVSSNVRKFTVVVSL